MRMLIAAIALGTLVSQTPPDGMAVYQVVLFSRAGSDIPPAAEEAREAHWSRIQDEGLLAASGPVVGDATLYAVVILRTPDRDRARAIAASDPHVEAGDLRAEVLRWWGPEGLGDRSSAVSAGRSQPVTYQLALLRAGPHRNQPAAEADQIQAAHLAHLAALTRAGKRLAGGPFLDDGPLRGMAVYAVSAEETREVTSADPAVRAGRLVVHLYRWLVPAGTFTPKSG